MHLVKGPLSLSDRLQQTYCGTPEPAFERSIQGTLIPAPGGSPGQTSQTLKAENLLSAPTAGCQNTLFQAHGRHRLVTTPLPASVSFSGAGHQGSQEEQESSLVCRKMEGRKAKVIKRKKKEERKRKERKRGRKQRGEGKGLGGK